MTSAWYAFAVEQTLRQTQHVVLWWPVFVAVGVGVFFSLASAPQPLAGVTVLGLAVALRFAFRKVLILRFLCFVLALYAAGFRAAQFRTARVAAPILAEEIGPTYVTGSVVLVEPVEVASRVTSDGLSLDELPRSEIPERVRVRLPASHGAPRISKRIKVGLFSDLPGVRSHQGHLIFSGIVFSLVGRRWVFRWPMAIHRRLVGRREIHGRSRNRTSCEGGGAIGNKSA